MKQKLFFIMISLLGMTAWQSCSDDDNDKKPVPPVEQSYIDALKNLYPNATKVEWERKGMYTVAEFDQPSGIDTEVWFNASAKWAMTVSDYDNNLSLIPAEVSNAFKAGEYSSWVIDEIKYYEREIGDFYLIDVEKKGSQDMDLYYSPDGTLIKAIPENDVAILPDMGI